MRSEERADLISVRYGCFLHYSALWRHLALLEPSSSEPLRHVNSPSEYHAGLFVDTGGERCWFEPEVHDHPETTCTRASFNKKDCPLCQVSSHVKTLKSTSSWKSILPNVTVGHSLKDMTLTCACKKQYLCVHTPSKFLPLAKSLRRCMTAAMSQSTEAYAWGMVVFDCVSL